MVAVLCFFVSQCFQRVGGDKFDFSSSVGTLLPESDEFYLFLFLFFGNVCRCGGCVHPR